METARATSSKSTLRCVAGENKLQVAVKAELREQKRERAMADPFPIIAEQWLPVVMSKRLRTPLPASAWCMHTLEATGTVVSSLLCSRTTLWRAAHAREQAAWRRT